MSKLGRGALLCSAMLAASLALSGAAAANETATAAAAAPAAQPSPEQIAALKEKLALATRILTREGLIASSGHISMRIPGTNLVLISPGNVTRDITTAADIVMVDLDSKQLEGTKRKPGETEIHTGIYRARPDVNGVIHAHTKYSVAFSVTNKPILPVHMHGAIFGDGVPVYPVVGHVSTRAEGDALAKTLGSHRAVVLKMHGTAVTGPTFEEAFIAALQLEENCEQQVIAAQSGGTVTPMSKEDVARAVKQSWSKGSIEKRWQYYIDKYGDLAANTPAR